MESSARKETQRIAKDTEKGIELYLIESASIMDQIPTVRLSLDKVITYDWATMVHKILKEMCPGIGDAHKENSTLIIRNSQNKRFPNT